MYIAGPRALEALEPIWAATIRAKYTSILQFCNVNPKCCQWINDATTLNRPAPWSTREQVCIETKGCNLNEGVAADATSLGSMLSMHTYKGEYKTTAT